MTSRTWRVLPPALLGSAFLVLQWLGRRSGSTRQERLRSLPGDGVVRRPQVRTDHARTVPAPPEDVWPWLTQMGWHRAGWYTPRWVDLALFPDNRPSADHLEPRWVREPCPGDRVPDGPPGTAEFVVEQADAPQVLLLHSTTHLPTSWRIRGCRVDWTWCFHLTAVGAWHTRVHVRVRGRAEPAWLGLAFVALLPPADLVMCPGMLRGLARRVASDRTCSTSRPIGTLDPARTRTLPSTLQIRGVAPAVRGTTGAHSRPGGS